MQIPIEFALFAATLAGVAVLHRRTFTVALSGLCAICAYKLFGPGFSEAPGLAGLGAHLGHEAVTVGNLFLLLTGFSLLARLVEDSRAPNAAPNILPDDWLGGVALLALTFVLSAFLDNIAAALIGATVARHVFQGRVQVGYLAAIVAASNAGGSGSVVGDTTTTMMWLDGVSPLHVLPAYVAAVAAFLVFAPLAGLAQQRAAPIVKHVSDVQVDWGRVLLAALVLASAVAANVAANLMAPNLLERAPVIGLAVWAALLAGALFRPLDWSVLPEAAKGALFLIALVIAASLMPVDQLPAPAWETTVALGVISAVFDNIPLTALALQQGGYDWGLLAFAVGYGGSMLWFGSSAGVAVANLYPEAKNALAWVREGWPVILGYGVGCLTYLTLVGWRPG